MISRSSRLVKREELGNVVISTSLERLKKARAVGCNPAYLGVDNYIVRKLFSRTANLLARFI